MLNRTCVAMLLLVLSGAALNAKGDLSIGQQPNHRNALKEFEGRYARGASDLLYFKIRDGKLTARPAFWHSIQVVELEKDSFVVAERRDRGGSFVRDARGEVVAVWIIGLGSSPLRYEKVNQSRKLPLELLFEGKGTEAFEGLSNECSYNDLLRVGGTFFEHFPSRASVAVQYLEGLSKKFSDSSEVHIILGHAYVAVAKRPRAVESFRRAHELKAGNQTAVDYLLRLHAIPIPAEFEVAKWKMPFSLNDLFKPATDSEIHTVRRMWSDRDLSAVEVNEVTRAALRFGTVDVIVRIVSHRVHGFLHYGAILVPAHAPKGSCAVVVEAKGVSWDYFPLDVNAGLNSLVILGPDLSHTVVIAPSFRGEKLILNGQEFVSEGDRTDNWDGATDDALALMNVALQTTPEADSTRIYTFGRSRGGSVAMLVAIRDKRIKGVVEWAGPTDWFALMSEEGWTQQELVEEGLRIHAKPYETAGQFIERFLLKAVDGSWDLTTTRLKMIASSPLYFASSLPALQLHHGVEDFNVPVANARALVEALTRQGRGNKRLESFLYEGFGHDTDVQVATARSHKFLHQKITNTR